MPPVETMRASSPSARMPSCASSKKRCNFPVDKISGCYALYWNAFKRLASGALAADKLPSSAIRLGGSID